MGGVRWGEVKGILPWHCALSAPHLWPPLLCWMANSLWKARNKTSPSLEGFWVLYLVIQGLLCCGWNWHSAGSGHGAGPMEAQAEAHSSGGHSEILPLLTLSASLVCGRWKPGAAFSEAHFPWSNSQAGLQCAPASVSPSRLWPCGCCPSSGWPWRTRDGSSGLCVLSEPGAARAVCSRGHSSIAGPRSRCARGAMSAAVRGIPPLCPGGGEGQPSLGVSGDSNWEEGFRDGTARDAQGSSPAPRLWELGWEKLEGLPKQGWVGESPPCAGQFGVAGV